MVRDLVIYRTSAGWPQAVLIEDGLPVEWIRPCPDPLAQRQDILLGRVEAIDRAIGAFIAIGQTENGLLPIKDVPPGLKPGQTILVQIRRLVQSSSSEQIAGKGHLLSVKLQYPGIFAVYEPEPERVIRRSKLSLLPEADQIALLDAEVSRLKEQHKNSLNQVQASGPIPRLLVRPREIVAAALSDWSRPDLRSIQTNDLELFQQLDHLLADRWPSLRSALILRPETFDLAAAFRLGSLGQETSRRTIRLKNGGSLVFDQTEALLVIDVNSQNAQASNPDSLRRKTNQLAVTEVVRQLRLRNIEGLVVIDFIRLKKEEDRNELVKSMTVELKSDPGKITIGGLTRLGLFELLRIAP